MVISGPDHSSWLIADFLSRTVLIAFLTDVGVQVAIGRIPEMLDISCAGFNPVVERLDDFSLPPNQGDAGRAFLEHNHIVDLLQKISDSIFKMFVSGSGIHKRLE